MLNFCISLHSITLLVRNVGEGSETVRRLGWEQQETRQTAMLRRLLFDQHPILMMILLQYVSILTHLFHYKA